MTKTEHALAAHTRGLATAASDKPRSPRNNITDDNGYRAWPSALNYAMVVRRSHTRDRQKAWECRAARIRRRTTLLLTAV